MTDYDNTNTFTLFKNDKGDNDKRPDYTGTIELDGGKKMRLAAWIREGKKGKFMSGKVSEFEQPAQQANAPADFDDDIPF